MSAISTQNLADSALEFLKEHEGRRFENADIARELGADSKVMRLILAKLRESGKIATRVISQRRYYLVLPNGQDNAFKPAAAPAQPRPAWVMPSAMRERMREIEMHRTAFPSKYAE